VLSIAIERPRAYQAGAHIGTAAAAAAIEAHEASLLGCCMVVRPGPSIVKPSQNHRVAAGVERSSSLSGISSAISCATCISTVFRSSQWCAASARYVTRHNNAPAGALAGVVPARRAARLESILAFVSMSSNSYVGA